MCGYFTSTYPLTKTTPAKFGSRNKSFFGFLKHHWSSGDSFDFKPLTKDSTFTGFLSKSVISGSSANTFKCIVLLLVVLHIQSVTALKIRRMSVPRWVENGTVDSVILDCDYEYTDRDTLLVVKWFLDSDPEPIYQWITEYDSRHASKRFQGHINLNFMVTPSNKVTRYRALNIIKPTTVFNGKYTCHVVSLTSQDTAEQIMTVYAPPKSFSLNYTKTKQTGANLSCEAGEVFPLPHITLYRSTFYEKEPQMLFDLRSQYDTTPSGAFDTRVSHEIVDKTLPSEEPTRYVCVLAIPGTRYKKQKEIFYYPGSPLNSASYCGNFQILWIILVALYGLCFS